MIKIKKETTNKNYYAIYFKENQYYNHRENLKKIIKKHGLIQTKIKNHTSEEMNKIYELMSLGDKLRAANEKTIKKNGISMRLEDNIDILKIYMFKEKESWKLPVLIIYTTKNTENNTKSMFHKMFISYCYKIGCLVLKLEKNNEKNKTTNNKFVVLDIKKRNIMLDELLDDNKTRKEIIKKKFLREIKNRKGSYSRSFVKNWLRCIDKYE